MLDQPTAPFLALLGGRVRGLRQAQGLTVAQLADRAGLSRRMLTQIELGQANPSLVTVDKVARALDTDFAGLVLSDDATEVLTVQAPRTATLMWSTETGSEARLQVVASDRGGPELWSWSLLPGDRYVAQPDPPGSEELLLVSDGTLTLHADGIEPTPLPAGTSARLASDRQYAYVNDGPEPAAFVRVVHIRR